MKVNNLALIKINEMISTKRFSHKTLALVLIVFSVFTITLTENLQISDGFSASATKIIFELKPVETRT